MPQPVPTPLRRLGLLDGVHNVWVKDESGHASGTFKDRLTSRAVELSDVGTVLATISYGNTAYSLALELERRPAPSVRGCVLVPEDMRDWVLGPSSTGATVRGSDVVARLERTLTVLRMPISGPVLDDPVIEELVRDALPEVDRVINITEGIAEPCYRPIIIEAVDQLGFVPDVVLVPFGAGILCNEIMDHLDGSGCDVVPLSVARRDSLARMLFGPIWLDTPSRLQVDATVYPAC